MIGSAALPQAKEEIWAYTTPKLNEAISTLVVSLDGAFILMREEGYREAMVGNISLYDVTGKRQHNDLYRRSPLNMEKALFYSVWKKKSAR